MPRTVYLIDDEEMLVDIHSEVIAMAGFDAHGFTSGNEFFDQVAAFETDSILMLDLHMPDMDGIEVMRRLASMDNPPALILVSGHDLSVLHSAERLSMAHGLNIIASLTKPLSLEYLKDLLLKYEPEGARSGLKKLSEYDYFSAEEVQSALDEKQFVLHYQPQIDIATGQTCGVETLLRWQHPNRGNINLERLMLAAEYYGLIGHISEWVLENAVAQQQAWRQQGHDISVSVNISASDVTSLVLPEKISDLLENHDMDPTMFILEITESALMGELVTSLDILTRLRLKGIGLSIDDFGTGYSSLSQLHRVPFTELKIDRSFVSRIANDSEALAIVKTCVMLGHELKMRTVAEGVESDTQLQLLKGLGCELAQGYYIARPMPAEELMIWLLQHGSTQPV